MVRTIYKIVRNLIFALTLTAVGIYLIAYILLALPGFNNYIKKKASNELSTLTGGRVDIGRLNISPFNEVVAYNLELFDPDGEKCIEIERVGVGIRLWKLLLQQKIELTYGEIIGLDAQLSQEEKDGPLNIQFLIEAFSSKDKNKEKKPFELSLRNVVLRKSSLSFNRPWMPAESYLGSLNLSHLQITGLAADIAFPIISDKGVSVDLRRFAFELPGLVAVNKIALTGDFGEKGYFINDFEIDLPDSKLFIPEVKIPLHGYENIKEALSNDDYKIEITKSYITPSDFSFILPALKPLTSEYPLALKAEGNLKKIKLENFSFGIPSELMISLSGNIENADNSAELSGEISDLDILINQNVTSILLSSVNGVSENLRRIFTNVGNLSLKGKIDGALSNSSLKADLTVASDIADIDIKGDVSRKTNLENEVSAKINISELRLSDILPSIPVQNIRATIEGEGKFKGKDISGLLSLNVEDFTLKNKEYEGFTIDVDKSGENLKGSLEMNNQIGDVSLLFDGHLSSAMKTGFLNCEIHDLDLSEVVDMKSYNGYLISGNITADTKGETIDDITGSLTLDSFSFKSVEKGKELKLQKLLLTSEENEQGKLITLTSDWLNANAEGQFRFKYLGNQIVNLMSSVFPVLIRPKEMLAESEVSDFEFQLSIEPDNVITEFLNLPVRLLVPIDIEGEVSGSGNYARLALDLPYLQQGKDKLIYDSRFSVNIDSESGDFDALIETTMPVKRGDLQLSVNLFGGDDRFTTELGWENTENSKFRGNLEIEGFIEKNPLSLKPDISLEFQPGEISMGETEWNISKATISYNNDRISVSDFKLWHDNQYVNIEGSASQDYSDVMTVRLSDIDVGYIFDMLQINYVTFGGIATGEIAGHSLLSSDPVAETETLKIESLSYNGTVLGDGNVSSRWNNVEKEIVINADIFHEDKLRVKCRGGIWLSRDSLAFNISTEKVPVDFIQPFMAVFSSHVGGFASGYVNLFGTFHDIDMTGKIFADSISMKVDYTNTVYHGSDSVILNPGRIVIPSFTLYDKNGKSAVLTGELTHRYFHDPSFNFRLSDAKDFLCYDTSSDINPDWYGILYGSGSAIVRGVPGIVNISADMTLVENSAFTFVLNDRLYAQDYQFLTFSDRRGDEIRARQPQKIDFKTMFKKQAEQQQGGMSKFGIDIRATVTPAVLFTLVMDPRAGDKITARGRGAMQVKYESDDDEMTMYGKYEIDEGNYNFSLQDIILRDFKIKEGSYIAFNGNPLRADLDISAAYRVNTNLTDLDKSFSTDRDLNRTNVPVDAILSVNGNMQQPNITFDIELPTLTQDVERKVKSIISTDDMMNRQIIYLLALNRFYTPEYMGSSGNGGELAAVASSTISSQLSNILGQMSDKVAVSPSFRSDKGDFSDIEVDVALSSRLLNNRLLINGNFGYRDKSNSSTTFVGDFDVEYLLNKNGNLRLKAYNHFNDQNYYLREALTTQGLGIIWRRDFDYIFRPKKNNTMPTTEEKEE